MSSAIPQEQFGAYRLTHLLGKGGMASVYRALKSGPMGFAKQVAIKRLHPALTENDQILKALINEARLGGQLKHPNIVEVYEFNKVNETYYLAMEFIDGWTLDRIIKLATEHEVPIPPAIVLQILADICQGLHYAHTLESLDGHEVKLVHRDLKPANVIISRDGVAKLMDFGIAKADTNLFKTTLADTTKGTPHYMSPEQVAGDPNLTARSDIFALGAVLYELLTGKILFPGESLVAVLFAVARNETEDQIAEVDEIVPGLGPIMSRCMAKDPDQRFQSADELRINVTAMRDDIGGVESLKEYIYRLRNALMAADGGLPDQVTVADGEPEFATLVVSDWAMAAQQQAVDLDEARKLADEAIGELSDMLTEADKADAAALGAAGAARRAAKAKGGPPGSNDITRDDETGKARRKKRKEGEAAPAGDKKKRVASETRVFAPDPERNKWRRRASFAALLLLFIALAGTAWVLLRPAPADPEPSDDPLAGVNTDDLMAGLDSEPGAQPDTEPATPAPVKAESTSRNTDRATPSPRSESATPAPVAVASVALEPMADIEAVAVPDAPPKPAPTPAPRPEAVVEAAPAPVTVAVGPPGTLKIKKSSPWADVLVDGKPSGKRTPLLGLELSPGRHTVTLVCKESECMGEQASKPVSIKSGQTSVLPGYDFASKEWK